VQVLESSNDQNHAYGNVERRGIDDSKRLLVMIGKLFVEMLNALHMV
jgi:hypothetical protein